MKSRVLCSPEQRKSYFAALTEVNGDPLRLADADIRERLRAAGFSPLEAQRTDIQFLTSIDRPEPVQLPLIAESVHLGEGGLNTVRRVREALLGIPLTIRQLKPMSSLNELQMNEILQVGKTDLLELPPHPHVATYWGRGQDSQGDEKEVLDYMSGIDLRHWLYGNRVTLGAIFDVATGVADALYYYHRHGLVHRDVKPENIIICPHKDGEQTTLRASLIDPDLVIRGLDESIEEKLKLKILMNGTLTYMAPELFRADNLPADYNLASADVYAWAMVLYRMLKSTVYSPEHWAYAKRIYQEMIEHHSFFEFSEDDKLPVDVRSLIMRAGSPDWRRRPTMARILEELLLINQAYRIDREVVVANPLASEEEGEDQEKVVRLVGNHALINPNFDLNYILPGTDTIAPLAEFKRGFDREIGIPIYRGTDEVQAQAVFEERTRFVKAFNKVRKQEIRLFPGVFDVVYERPNAENDNLHIIWIIRPKLQGWRYLKQCQHMLTHTVRLRILHDVATSLALLEEAGYVHPGINLDSIYVVPPQLIENPYEPEHSVMNRETDTQEYYIRIDKNCKIELMGMNYSHPLNPLHPDTNLPKYLYIVSQLWPGNAQPMIDRINRHCRAGGWHWREVAKLLIEKDSSN